MKDWLSLCWFVRLTKGSVGTKIGGKVEGVEGLFRVLVVVSDNPGYIEDVEAFVDGLEPHVFKGDSCIDVVNG